MKKTLALALVLATTTAALASDGGTVRITNRDGSPHSIELDAGQRILHVLPGEAANPGEVTVPAGGAATTELLPGAWTVYGDGSQRFTIMVARGGDYELTLQPFSQTNAYGGVSHGLLGLIDDGYNQSSYQLFSLSEAPPPVVTVQPAPVTPPVVVVPSPSYYYPPPPRRDHGRDLGEAIGSAVFDILGNVLSDDHHHRRRPPPPRHHRR